MKSSTIARIRQIRQSLFARFAGVQSSVDHAPDRERKLAAVRQLSRILNNDSNVWVPTQVVADRSNGVFARLRRGLSQRVSAMTIRNPFGADNLERTKRAFAFSFIETTLEKRQLLATLTNDSSQLIFTLDDGDVLTGTTTTTNNNANFVLTTGTLINNTTGLTSLTITSNSVTGDISDDGLDVIKVIGTSVNNNEIVTLNNYSTTSYSFIAGSDVGL